MREEATKQSILLVDDNGEIRALMKARLEKLYRIFEAADGRQAVELAEQEHPNLVLIDFNQPVLDGFVASKYIRQLNEMQDVPIVGLTGHGHEGSHSLAMASGCNDYLEKPIDLDHLELTVKRWLTKE